MTTTTASFSTIAIDDAAREGAADGRAFVRIRRELGIQAFGVSASYQAAAGERVIGEHDELGPGAGGHEELYVVVRGAATFTIDGEQVDAPQGTAVFVPPASKRSAVAAEDETIVLAIGGKPGEPYAITPGEAMGTFFQRYQGKDYAGALEECTAAFDLYPGNALVLYNVACMSALLGREDDALAALAESVGKWPAYKELAAADDDFASLREDSRFQELIA